MLKRIFISIILLLALLSFVVSLLGGKNSIQSTDVTKLNGPKIAVINVEGTISSSSAGHGLLYENTGAGSGRIMEELRQAAKDNRVKAVLLHINSPGGSVTAAEEITREIVRFKEESKKPLVVSMGDMGASAGYYIAAPADKIYANASTLTGSIGVYMSSYNLEELYQKLGVSGVMIKSGKHKDILSPSRPMTEEEKTILQNMVNEMYGQFVKTVSTYRNIPEPQVRALADGRVYTGAQAKELGLVDELGNYYDAIDATAKLANISGTPELLEYNAVPSWQSFLKSELTQPLVKQLTSGLLESLQRQGAEQQTLTPRS